MASARPPRRRILVAEDSPTQAEALRAILEDAGYDVALARDGQEALTLVAQQPPDLILSDVVMPRLDGLGLCGALKRHPEHGSIPIVLVTSLTEPLDVVRGLECGAENYITKPYEPEQLLARIERVLDDHAPGNEAGDDAVEITFLGEHFTIHAAKRQILHVLISSFEELIRSNEALRASEQERARQLESERQARAEAEATSRRLRLLHHVSDAAVADTPVHEFLRNVVDVVRAGLAADTIAVLLLDDTTQELVVEVAVGLEAEAPAGLRIPAGRGIDGGIVRAGGLVVVEDVQAAPEVVSRVLRERVRSMVGAPLVTGQGVFGVLHMGSESRRHFENDDVELLRLVAERMALFIERARLNERERAARLEAEEARLGAEAANRAKSEFLAMMSHDLRTPLNAIGGYTQLLEMGLRGPVTPEQLRDLDRIKQNQRSLLALLNDLLNITRIERGTVPLNLQPVDVSAALRAVGSAIKPQMAQKGLSYEVSAPAETVAALADPDRLEQVLLNLLTNAIKFTPAGGRIAVSAAGAQDRVHFSVADSGIGIPAEKLQTIFDPFVQVDSRRVGEQQGVGLGLSICRSLLQLMGGELTVESEVGRGSTFAFSLPLARDGGHG